VQRKIGKLGQFDVLVDGQVIASRDRSGWPDPQVVIDRIEALQQERLKA
jgi:predicted Rdx family selenoprotein